MSLPRPTGLKAPSKTTARTGTGLPQKSGLPAPGSRPQSALAKSARAAGLSVTDAEHYANVAIQNLRGPECTAETHSTDDFKIGDRVWLGGTKPGRIAFIGETKFAAGDWAGVVLDQPVGKNDGSVNGVKYFQCEPMKGVFSRVSKLTRQPVSIPPSTPKPGDSRGESPAGSVNSSGGMTNGALPLNTPHRPQSRLGLAGSKAPSSSTTSLNNSVSATVPKATSTPMPGKGGVKIGDRVLVSGSKTGVLRFMGETEFAKGDWAGVELDEQMGKNDGAVAGKRYFDCKPMFGLFAPIHKVTKISANYVPNANAMTRSLNTSLRSTRDRSGSQDSISSISSSASSVSRSRVRLGVSTLGSKNVKSAQRSSGVGLSTSTSALQKALKEKEDHIEQLLRERDLERAEVARAAAQADDAETKIAALCTDQNRYREESDEQLLKLRAVVTALEKENNAIKGQLEDEKRKCEDLQFQIEEEVIDKDDLESRTEVESARVEELERWHRKEKERAERAETELATLKSELEDKSSKLKENDETQLTYLDQLEELTHKLTLAENKIKNYEASKLDEGAKTSQVGIELAEKTNRVGELEDLLAAKNQEFKQLQDKLNDVLDELKISNEKKEKMQVSLDEMKSKMESHESSQNQLSEELKTVRSNHSDLQRQLDTSNTRAGELADDRNKLEQQLADLMKNSGDSSTQLSLLNDELTEKNRKLEEAQNNLSSYSQKISKLNEDLGSLREEGEKQKEDIVNKHNQELSVLQGQLGDVQAELDKSKNRVDKLTEDFNKEKDELMQRKDNEISNLKNQIATSIEALGKQETQTQAHKQVLEQITLEKESLKFEKEKLEKNIKRMEGEKEGMNKELIQIKVEMTKLAGEQKTILQEKDATGEKLEILEKSVDKLEKLKTELEKQRDDLKKEKNDISEERDEAKQEVIVLKAEIQKKDIVVENLQKEVEKLKQESAEQSKMLMEKSQTESESSELATKLDKLEKALETAQKELSETQSERNELKVKLQEADLVSEQRKKLEDEKAQLLNQLQETNKSHSEELNKIETEKTSLQSKIDNSSSQLTQQSRDIQVYQQQISDLQNENTTLSDLKDTVEKLENKHQDEKLTLNKKIEKLETELKESQEKSNILLNTDASGVVDPVKVKLLEENESSTQQISFLNNLIVGQQTKIHDLQVRLQAMESGNYSNGNGEISMEEASPTRQKPAPRLFCDICDIFDKHDTDDCPTQAMSESPEPSRHHGSRESDRPYCETCEVFGHSTEDCDDDQMF